MSNHLITDINRNPPPLRNSPNELPPQTPLNPRRIPRTLLHLPRRQPAQQRLGAPRRILRRAKRLPRLGVQERRVPQGPGESRPTACESHDGSRGHGCDDGYDEGEYDDDDSADVDYELD